MNTLWSDRVQGVMTLYLSRKLRFDDFFFSQYRDAFALDPDAELNILEIGCGPGALAEALRRWYPRADISAVDRDSAFISFARKTVGGVRFIEGDATRLPFDDCAFDVVISNTVQEHVEPSAFWGEQLRVLRPGGVCLCLSARRGLRCVASCLEQTDEEKKFWTAAPDVSDEFEKNGVCRFPMTEAQLPAAMKSYGFRDVTTGYAVVDLTPDDPKYSAEKALAMIESDRQCDLEAIRSMRAYDSGVIAAVNGKYDERVRLYNAGVKQWDTTVSVTMILRGVK